ncbi:MAG: hypothetical protein D6820_13230, partial [Lentisphaerae bacterium]
MPEAETRLASEESDLVDAVAGDIDEIELTGAVMGMDVTKVMKAVVFEKVGIGSGGRRGIKVTAGSATSDVMHPVNHGMFKDMGMTAKYGWPRRQWKLSYAIQDCAESANGFFHRTSIQTGPAVRGKGPCGVVVEQEDVGLGSGGEAIDEPAYGRAVGYVPVGPGGIETNQGERRNFVKPGGLTEEFIKERAVFIM